MKAKTGLLGAIVGAALVAGFSYWSFGKASGHTPAVSYAVKRGDLELSVLASGTLRPARLVAVGAQVSGRITAVLVSPGDVVKQGDLIAKIDSVTKLHALKKSRAALDFVEAQRLEKSVALDLKQQDLTRQEAMYAKHSVSRADYDNAVAEVAMAKAQLKQLDAQVTEAELAVESAKADLDFTKIIAPIDGTVLSIVSQEGQTVNAAQSAPTIAILGQLDEMIVRTTISEADVTRVHPGMPVHFSVTGAPEERYDAVLESIDPAPESIKTDGSFSSANASSGSQSTSAIYYSGTFRVKNPHGRLRTYMTAEVHIVLERMEDVLTVPSSVLGHRARDGTYALPVVSSDGHQTIRQVQIGLNDKINAEVRSGLEAGDRILVGTLHRPPHF
ncbi:efflux RND transporter periplasmic adaptor subunit [Roseibium sp.]|uniref:efflux RND transporter periplasmic adaptor subunit n=1 Tax=Roseibium sp. TaxID=1936156 RepID=UPI003BAE5158